MKYAIINIEVLEKRINTLKNRGTRSRREEELNFKELDTLLKVVSNTIPLEKELEKAFDKGVIWNIPDQCIIEEKVSKKEYIQNLKLSI